MLTVPAFALTGTERKLVFKAQSELRQARQQFDDAKRSAGLSDQRASEAETHASLTDRYAKALEKRVSDHYSNEQRLSSMVNQYKPFWDQGHKYFGFGAVLLGLGMIAKNTLILIAGLIVLAAIFWGLSFAFPALKPIIVISIRFIKSAWVKFLALFEKKQ